MSSEIDLHVHSIYSDGTFTPKELVYRAKEKKLKAIALTDHDTVDGMDEIIAEGNEHNLEIIPGIEINCDYGYEVHIIGLFIDYKLSSLSNKLQELNQQRIIRNKKIIEKLNNLGINVNYEDVLRESNGNIIGRPHIARAMTAKGYAQSINEVFDEYLAEDKVAFVKRDDPISPKDAIKLIKNSKGISFLAHPGLLNKSKSEIEEIIKEYKKTGLDGIEVYHSNHDKSMTYFLSNIANRHKMLVSGGSDFHGKNKLIIDLGTGKGNLNIKYDILQKMKDYKKTL